MVDNTVTNSKFLMLLYKNKPVQNQKSVWGGVEVTFYNRERLTVSELEWRTHSRKVLVPRTYGSRKDVVKNWHKLGQLVLSHTTKE